MTPGQAEAPTLRGWVERVEGALSEVARSAAESGLVLSDALVERLRRVCGTTPGTARRPAGQAELLRVAAFVLFEALVVRQIVCAPARGAVEPGASADRRPARPPVPDVVRAPDELAEGALARDLLAALRKTPASERLLAALTRLARAVSESGVLTRSDLLGRIYHRLLMRGHGAAYATYYTSAPAARLLAALSFGTERETEEARAPAAGLGPDTLDSAGVRVLDPACGSGTLLSAAYIALCECRARSRTERRGAPELSGVPAEDVLHGWDVMPYAAHLARTTLACHRNGSRSPRAAIVAVRTGLGARGAVHLGALDALAPNRAAGTSGEPAPGKLALWERGRAVGIALPGFDVVIMNPPFSRSANPGVKFGYSDPHTKARMDARLRAITRQLGVGGIGHAGLAAYFVVLAHRLLKTGGRLAVVLPRSCLSGVSWAGIRELILNEYQLEYVITNADPGDAAGGVEGWNWSEHTDLGEAMWIARKVGPTQGRAPVRFVNLARKPRDDEDSARIASEVERAAAQERISLADGHGGSLTVDGAVVGAVYSVAQRELRRNWLFPCVFASARLNAFAHALVARPRYATVPLGTLLARAGPDIAQVKRGFERAGAPTAFPIVWGHQGAMNTMMLDDAFIGHGTPRAGARGAELHRTRAATLLIAERPHLHTEALLSLATSVPVLSTAFWELRLAAPRLAGFLQLWFQSTFGFVSYLAHATSSMGDIFKLKKGQLTRLPVARPDLAAADDSSAAYDEIRATPWLRHPDEFARAARGEGPRKAIDDLFVRRLDLGIDLRPIYELLATDPVVTARRGPAHG